MYFYKTNCNNAPRVRLTHPVGLFYTPSIMNHHILTLLRLAAVSIGILTSFGAQAAKISINGTVTDYNNGTPVSYADVAAYTSTDSLADVQLTDDKGNYTLSLNPGTYSIKVEYLGYKKYTRNLTVTSEQPDMHIRTIALHNDAQMLKTAVVQAKAIAVKTNNDTVEYNASSFKVAEGSAIDELIKKLPGAQVGSDGTITVNGKQITKILVNGKEFFSDDPKVALKNLPANMVDKVKAYDKKSDESRLTGIDDGEEESVLDLTVKKDKMQGWFGNAQAGVGGTPFHFDLSTMLNRFDENQNLSILANGNDINSQGFGEKGGGPQRAEKAGDGLTTSAIGGINYIKQLKNLKYGGNVRYGYNDNDARKKSESENFLSSGSTYDRDTLNSRRKRNEVALDFQLEWNPDSMSSLIFRPNFNYSHTAIDNNERTHNLNQQLLETNASQAWGSTSGDNLSAGGLLLYVRRLNNKGRNFSVSAKTGYDYAASDVYNRSNTLFHFYNSAREMEAADSLLSLNRYTDNGSNSFSYRLQASYTEPISTHHALQLRYSYQQRKTLSSSYIYDQDLADSPYIDSLSSKVRNTYDTHEMELNLQGRYTKLMYKAGFDLSPQTSNSTTTVGPNAGRDLSQTVWNYAPNLMIRYRWNKKNMLMVRYRGQSSAPDVQYLQEIIDQSNPLNIKYGNPDLEPSYTNRLMLRYNNYITRNQSNLAVNASFSNTLNAVTDKVEYNSTTGSRKTYMTNVDGNWNTSGFVSYLLPIGSSPFSISTTSQASYANNVGYATDQRFAEQKSTTHNTGLKEKLTGTYNKDNCEFTLNTSLAYVKAHNNLTSNANRETYDYVIGGTANVTLPWQIDLSTDLNYNGYSGYADAFKDHEVIWNAQLSRSFLKGNAATIRLKMFDILQQQSSLSRTVSANTISDVEYNTLGSYFMVYFVYKFNTFGGKLPDAATRGFGRGGRGPRDGGMPRGDFGGDRNGFGPMDRPDQQPESKTDSTKTDSQSDSTNKHSKLKSGQQNNQPDDKEDHPAPPEGEMPPPPDGDGGHPMGTPPPPPGGMGDGPE